MRCKPHTSLLTLAVLLLQGAGVPAFAACTAGTTNAAVAESTPSSDFTVNADGTVLHKKTGLMWKQCVEGRSGAACATGAPTQSNWSNALKAANTANAAAFAGYSDWRLPNRKELSSIVERCGHTPAINATAFPATISARFWSSTSGPSGATAWWVGFVEGRIDDEAKATATYYTRLVRGGQSYDALLNGKVCRLDADGNGSIDALTDGLIIMRAMFGLTGTAVTAGAVGAGATRTTWAQIQPYLNAHCGTAFLLP